jgi:glucose-6-phosphate 1-epimerase
MHMDLPAGVTLTDGQGGLPRLLVNTTACTAELYLHGAHLCQWQPRSQAHPVLWMSQESRFAAGTPIRGGVPICFPWFGPKPGDATAPAHGLARLASWTLAQAAVAPDGTTSLTLSLACAPGSNPLVPEGFALRFALTLGASLTMALTVEHVGTAGMRFDEALHTYLSVSDVRQVQVAGLNGATYLDKVDGAQRKVQGEAPITIVAETDRLFVNTDATVTLTDPGFGRTIVVEKTGSHASVVWNPWIAKSRAMPDFGDDEWPGMICLETVNAADNAVELPPHGTHTMTATVRVV